MFLAQAVYKSKAYMKTPGDNKKLSILGMSGTAKSASDDKDIQIHEEAI